MSAVSFYVAIGERTIGPVTEQEVLEGIRVGKVPRDADICRVGDSEWRVIHEVEPFASAFAPTPPPPPPPRRTGNGKGVRWSRLGLLAKIGVVVIGVFAVIALVNFAMMGAYLLQRRPPPTAVAQAPTAAPATAPPTAPPAVALPPPTRDVRALIVGTWVHSGLAPEVYSADGVMRLGNDPPGTYRISGTPSAATMITTTALGVRTWLVTFPDDDTMTCDSLLYRRVGTGGAPRSVASVDDASTLIIGSWRAGSLTETFTAHGGYLLNSAPGVYEITGPRERASLRTRNPPQPWREWEVSFPSADTMVVRLPGRMGGLTYQRLR